MANLELRPNEKSINLGVPHVWVRPYGSTDDFFSLGHSGIGTMTFGRESFEASKGSPLIVVKKRTISETFTAEIELKANTDLDIFDAVIPTASKNASVSRRFHKDERVKIDLGTGPAFSANVIEGNFADATSVSLYTPDGATKGVLNADFQITEGTGLVEALTAPFQVDDCLITYDYVALADEINIGGFASCAESVDLEVKMAARLDECRADEQDFQQLLIHIYKCQLDGEVSFLLQPESADPITVSFAALADTTRARGDQLLSIYKEQ